MTAWLDALLRPGAVALIGVSDDAGKTTGRPLAYLRRHGFAGAVYPVNPARRTVQGERAFARLADVPGPVDHAFVLLGHAHVPEAIADCARHGVKLATVLADGYADAGPDGLARQRDLVALAGRSGVRLLGPNALGAVVPPRRMALTANAAFRAATLPAGRLMLLSQSGSMLGALFSRGAGRGIGFAALVSVGNEADLSIGEIGAAAADDPGVDAFLLFLETLRDRAGLARFAARAAAAGKPILALKLGRSALGREAALSHTGALLGGDRPADAFLAAHGIARVDQLETLLEAPALFVGRRPGARRAAAGGGDDGGAMVVDRLGLAGIAVNGLDDAARARLAAKGIAAKGERLVDVTLAGTESRVMGAVLGELAAATDNDVVLAVAGSSAQFEPERAVAPIAAAARAQAKPLAVCIVPDAPETLARLAAAGIAAFRTPESAADGVRAFLAWRKPAPAETAAAPALPADLAGRGAGVLHEAEAYRVLAALGIASAPHVVAPAPDAIDRLPGAGPYAVKILSPDLPHRSELGGVRLGLADAASCRQAAAEIVAAVSRARPGAPMAGVLVQAMRKGVGEVLLGYRRDAEAGPVVTLGAGGILAELIDAVSVRLAPVSAATAREMISECRALAPLAGYRGQAMGDLAALAECVVAFSRLALVAAPGIVEAEINPLMVMREGEGVVAVDALMRLAAPAPEAQGDAP
jgi:acetate---CoA ligase (ADP-forming)